MRALVAAIVAALLLAPVTTVRADPTEDAALLHIERGVAAFRAGDYLKAHRDFETAHDLVPERANPYRWLALTEIQLGDCKRALVNIEGFLSRVKPDEPRVPELVRLRDLCQRTGVLRVEATPPSVALRLDGAYVGTTPFRALSLQSGSHTLIADKPGHRSVTRSIVLPAGGELDVHLDLPVTRRPLVKRWWFWTAVAGTAAATVAVVVIAGRDGETVLPPIQCGDAGCTP